MFPGTGAQGFTRKEGKSKKTVKMFFKVAKISIVKLMCIGAAVFAVQIPVHGYRQTWHRPAEEV